MDLFIGLVALFFFIMFFILIKFYFNNFILFIYSFFPPFSSELCGSKGLGPLAGCQA